jgi:S1-C subfamily serine protease
MRTMTALAVAVVALLAAAVAGAAGGGVAAWWLLAHDGTAPLAAPTAGVAATAVAAPLGAAAGANADDVALAAVRATRPAVVTVWNVGYVQPSFFQQPRLDVVAEGSGVVFDARGYIATNAHVVKGAQKIAVVFLDGRRVDATLVGIHEAYDVAILRIQDTPMGVARLADSSQLEPGMRVIAIGSPLGTQYQNTVTTGIVAGLNRRVTESYYNFFTQQPVELDLNAAPLIQTDAAINAGNSGGPLVDMQGEAVALNTLIVRRDGGTSVEGLGFAVPSNVVRALADQWIDGVPLGWLGLDQQTLDPALAEDKGLDRGTGALVEGVTPGSPAAGAGIQVGDVITAINGVALDVDHGLADQLWRYRAGDRVVLEVARGDSTFQVEAQLVAEPK